MADIQNFALCAHCVHVIPPTSSAGRKSELATSPLPSQGPKRGRNCYVTPAFSGAPQRQARGENQKCGSLYPQLEGPHQSVGVHIPNSRGHTKVWESVSPTQGATPKRGTPYPQLKGPLQGMGKKEMTHVGQVQNFLVGSSNHILNSMGRGSRGGGVRPHGQAPPPGPLTLCIPIQSPKQRTMVPCNIASYFQAANP